MNKFVKPKLVISKCLAYDCSNYNNHNNTFFEKLEDYLEIITICPEADLNLTELKEILIKKNNLYNQNKLIEEIKVLNEDLVDLLSEIDGFILKGELSSCNSMNCKFYKSYGNLYLSKEIGLFIKAISLLNSKSIIESHSRIDDISIREEFLRKIFLWARFRSVQKSNSLDSLLNFHQGNKLLIFAYGSKYIEELNDLISTSSRGNLEKVLRNYELKLYQALSSEINVGNSISILLNCFRFFSKYLLPTEKDIFLKSLEEYQLNQAPLSILQYMISSWINNYQVSHLKKQRFFNPYPRELMEVKSSELVLQI
ncbi:DUF1722 domain-containing protein [Orenia marismortui]|uniref:Uncharacterized protein YbgA (DUF1722 family) n=1 Tax=Orenia marismortui TaxID=46469 RepID=A0A4R8H0Y2_9FIRM|nr:DUF1722 domain-containing protein [Orenia marismortui]TDX53212.1 uncharacterized protein YbgA (DUF1722 family) [Orenia marismortui]